MDVKVLAGILAGGMVSGMYLTSSRSVWWWLMCVAYVTIVGWIRWQS